MPQPLSHKYPISISQLCLENTDVPAGVGAPPLDTTSGKEMGYIEAFSSFLIGACNLQLCQKKKIDN